VNLDWRAMLGAVGVLWIGYVFVGYPVLLAAVARLRRIRPIAREDQYPTVSVLISARNEENDIEWKIKETLAWDWDDTPERLDVWVASDASDDRTDEILRGIWESPALTRGRTGATVGEVER
jgi:cellulose synthase/poly-beta-1,6-N-acetylglucosamine synthase-like glycosyltransferase